MLARIRLTMCQHGRSNGSRVAYAQRTRRLVQSAAGGQYIVNQQYRAAGDRGRSRDAKCAADIRHSLRWRYTDLRGRRTNSLQPAGAMLNSQLASHS